MGDPNGNGHDRDPVTGRLLPGHRASVGNRGGGANPTARRMNELRKVLMEAATEDDVRTLYRSLLDSAKGGDTAAARCLLEYLVGKPVSQVEVSRPDGPEVGVTEVVAAIVAALGDDQESIGRVAAAFDRLGRGGGAME